MKDKMDLLKCHGKRFKAYINDINEYAVEGKISVDGENVYLCHNINTKVGNKAPDLLGYLYSWQCKDKDSSYIEDDEWGVYDLKIIEDKEVSTGRLFTEEDISYFKKRLLPLISMESLLKELERRKSVNN